MFSSNKGSKTVIFDQKSFYHDATRLKIHWHLQWLMHSSSCFLSTIAFFNVWKCIDTRHILYILYQMHNIWKRIMWFHCNRRLLSLRRWYECCNLMLLTMCDKKWTNTYLNYHNMMNHTGPKYWIKHWYSHCFMTKMPLKTCILLNDTGILTYSCDCTPLFTPVASIPFCFSIFMHRCTYIYIYCTLWHFIE